MDIYIEKLKITKLFGAYDLDIDFTENYNIIIGENGVGKTTVLNILNAILSTQFEKLRDYDFEKIQFNFCGECITILKEHINIISPKTLSNKDNVEDKINNINRTSDSTITYYRLMINKLDSIDVDILNKIKESNISDELKLEFKNNDFDIADFQNFIENDNNYINILYILYTKIIIEKLNSDILFLPTYRIIEKSIANTEVLRAIIGEDIQTDLNFIEDYLIEVKNKLFELYKNDNKENIKEQLNEIQKNIYMFVEYCNKYLFNKKMVYDDNHVNLNIDARGQMHSLNDTSSGEKQIIFLFAKMFFSDRQVILIYDEPEISMSLEWQEQVLVDVVKSSRCKSMMVATHSPFIFKNELQHNAFSLSRYITEAK